MYDIFPFITDGIVKDTEDPQQNGRIKIWCPALDGENFDIALLPWAEYASPFGGVTNDFQAGRNKTKSGGPVSYGFWALPKIGAQVLVFLLNGDPSRRFYFASYFGLHRNRSLPLGRNKNENDAAGPFTDTYDPLQPAYDNARIAFQNKIDSPQAKNRGVFERQVGQDKSDKDGKDGYSSNPVDGKYLDSQTYCFTTPGHHTFILDDSADNCRIRLKTCEGNQIIIDDTNERIYISTAKGKTWIELDEDGHMHVFGSQSVSVRAGQDINFYADNDFNVEAGNNVNIKALKGETKISAKSNIHLKSSGGSIYQTAGKEFHICSTNDYFLSANNINNRAATSILQTADSGNIELIGWKQINVGTGKMSMNMKDDEFKLMATSGTLDFGSSLTLGASVINTNQNSGSAGSYSQFYQKQDPSESEDSTSAEEANGPSVVPGHEPWKRPKSAKNRNKYWSE